MLFFNLINTVTNIPRKNELDKTALEGKSVNAPGGINRNTNWNSLLILQITSFSHFNCNPSQILRGQ